MKRQNTWKDFKKGRAPHICHFTLFKTPSVAFCAQVPTTLECKFKFTNSRVFTNSQGSIFFLIVGKFHMPYAFEMMS